MLCPSYTMDGGMGVSESVGLLIPEQKNVDIIPILNEKIKALQTTVDELSRFKSLYEQSAKMIIDKDKEIATLKQDKEIVNMNLMEANAYNFKLQKDLARMPELENRDIARLKAELFEDMEFRLTVQQAKLIGGKTMFAKEWVVLKFDGHSGLLISNFTDT